MALPLPLPGDPPIPASTPAGGGNRTQQSTLESSGAAGGTPAPLNPPPTGVPEANFGVPAQTLQQAVAKVRRRTPGAAQVRARPPVVRPGFAFQDRLLWDFYTPATPFFAASGHDRGTLWVTPVLPIPLNCHQVAATLMFHLAAPPVTIRVRSPRPMLFSATMASRSVAAFCCLARRLGSGRFQISLHSSRCEAESKLERLALLASGDINVVSPAPVVETSIVPSGTQSCAISSLRPPRQKFRLRGSAYLILLPSKSNPPLPPLLDSPRLDTYPRAGCNDGTPLLVEPNAGVTAHPPMEVADMTRSDIEPNTGVNPPPPCSYKEAILTLARPLAEAHIP